jgi:diguanylate cyclase (GGDEF)-like protein
LKLAGPKVSPNSKINDQDQAEHALKAGFRSLRFPPELEAAFVRAHADERTIKLLLAGMAGVLLFGAITLTDHFISPELVPRAQAQRQGTFGPFVLVLLALLHRLSLPELNEWMVLPMATVAVGVVLALAADTAPHLAFTRVMELIIVVIYTAVFTRFWPMVALSAMVSLAHGWLVLAMPETVDGLRLGCTLLTFTTVTFALYSCYSREHHDRLSYLLALKEQGLREAIDEANRRLDTMARTDALTGLPNRRAFDDALNQTLAALRAPTTQADHGPIALLMVDVDHFKAYNDHYGHPEGDHCLREVGQAVASCLRRPVDMVARWGGEEFAVLLHEADANVAAQVGERICAAVRDRALAHEASRCAPVVTVSVGVAPWHADPAPGAAAAWLQAADDALYQAKAQGRNRTVVAGRSALSATPC